MRGGLLPSTAEVLMVKGQLSVLFVQPLCCRSKHTVALSSHMASQNVEASLFYPIWFVRQILCVCVFAFLFVSS